MGYDKDLISAKLVRWEAYLNKFRLPAWEKIPDIGLYMEQLTGLLHTYLNYLPPELHDEQYITPASINNYVRKRIIPQPVQKKYYRTHIAYLIMLCTLKQCLSIPTVQTLLPVDLSETELKTRYDSFVNRHHLAAELFIETSKDMASRITQRRVVTDLAAANTEELITTVALLGGFSRLMSEKLLLLNDRALADVDPDELAPM